jgi:branched-chain amino acid transport system ATP-binding protein
MGVGRTFQITATFASMTVVENVQMALLSHHQQIMRFLPSAHKMHKAKALELLAMVGMEEQAERHCAVLAYGDLKRLELAIALAHDPAVLLMDEPTAGMAPRERIALMQLTADIVRDQGVSVLFTEHDMDVVFAHAHRIMVLNRGELIAEGNVSDVRENPRVQEVYLGGGTVFQSEGAVDHA